MTVDNITDLKIAKSCIHITGAHSDDMIVFLGISRWRYAGAPRDSNPIWARISHPIPEYGSRYDFLVFFDESESIREEISIRNPILKVPETKAERDAIRQAVAERVCFRSDLLLRAMIEFHEIGCEAGASQSTDVRYSLERIRALLAQRGMQYNTRTLADLGAMRSVAYAAKGLA
jgi:hypothetical protein